MIVAMPIELLHPDAFMPIHNENGASCFQLKALVENPEGEYIAPNGKLVIRTGLKITVPPNWVIELYPRRASDLTLPPTGGCNVGLLDNRYAGEVMVQLVNDSPSVVLVQHGDVIADGILTQVHGARFIDLSRANPTGEPLTSPVTGQPLPLPPPTPAAEG